MKRIIYTQEELGFIKKHSTLPRKELWIKFNETFNKNINKKTLASLCKKKGWLTGRTGCFVKGQEPVNKGTKGLMKANKTSFKKGCKPHNATKIGYERISKYGHIEVKVAKPNVFRFKHRLVWEKHNGKIPKGLVVVFKDENPKNLAIENLEMLTRLELLQRNHLKIKQAPAQLKPSLKLMAKLKATAIQRK